MALSFPETATGNRLTPRSRFTRCFLVRYSLTEGSIEDSQRKYVPGDLCGLHVLASQEAMVTRGHLAYRACMARWRVRIILAAS
jgi:hypothetical protein